jgi:hypothetical protein
MASDRELEEIEQTIDSLRWLLHLCARRERWPRSPVLRISMRDRLAAALEPIYQATLFTEPELAAEHDSMGYGRSEPRTIHSLLESHQ